MRKHITWREIRSLTPAQFLYRLGRFVRRYFQGIYHRLANPEFQKIVDQADGLCSVPVYQRIFNELLPLPDLDIVEIGAAAGASTITCAMAMQHSNKHSAIVVVEKCVGGSRERYGGFEDNLQRLKHNLAKFGAQDRVRLFAQELSLENGEEALRLIQTKQIAALLCDADGRIDRDFILFWPRLVPGGAIIIDDYISNYKTEQRCEWLRLGHDKQVLTTELLNYFTEVGLFEKKAVVDNSVFGFKPHNANWTNCDLERCGKIVEEVLFELDRIRALAA